MKCLAGWQRQINESDRAKSSRRNGTGERTCGWVFRPLNLRRNTQTAWRRSVIASRRSVDGTDGRRARRRVLTVSMDAFNPLGGGHTSSPGRGVRLDLTGLQEQQAGRKAQRLSAGERLTRMTWLPTGTQPLRATASRCQMACCHHVRDHPKSISERMQSRQLSRQICRWNTQPSTVHDRSASLRQLSQPF